MKQKLLLMLALAAGFAFRLDAQFTPQGFNYQSVVRNSDGTALANQTVTLLFTLRSGAPNGPIAYAEKHTLSTNEFGLVNLTIGQGGEPQFGDFTTINWGGGAKFLTVSIETSPGAFDDLGATQLMSVPYALYAQTAANGGGGGGGDNWGSQTVQTGASLTGNGTAGNPIAIAQQGATNGQVLKWNGSAWTPQNDLNDNGFNGTVTQINTGNGLTGGPITASGTIGLTTTGVTPGIYGSSTQIPVIQVDAQGRVSNVFTVVPQPGTVDIDGAAGITVQQNGFNFIITNTGDVNAADDITTSTQASGDVSGPFANLQLNANTVGSLEIQNNAVGNSELADNAVTTAKIAAGAVTAAKIDDMNASNGQVLKWNGTTWAPSTDASGITAVGLSAGTGINVSGASPNFTVSNTGDTNPNDDLTTSSQANGDVSGPFSNLQIDANAVGSAEIANGAVGPTELADNAVTTAKIANGAVTAAKLDDMNAANGQVLKWNGTAWAPANEAGGGIGTLVAGQGIDIFNVGSAWTVENIGDTNPDDDLTTTSQAGGDLSGPFANLQIDPGVVGTPEIANGAVTAAKLDDMNASTGQVLKFNGTAWAPATDNTGGGGGGGDDWGAQVVVTNATLTGSGIVGSALGIAPQGATNGQVLKFNGTSWVPGNDNTGTPGGGDDWGTQVVVTNATLTGTGVTGSSLGLAPQGASNGQVLKFNGTTWVPANDLGDAWGTQVVQAGNGLSGNGTTASPLRIAQQGATTGQVLKWNGTGWAPDDDDSGIVVGGNNYSAGPGISITGSSPNFVINNTGDDDDDPFNELQTLSLSGNVLKISTTGSQVTLPSAPTYTAGSGISITGASPSFTVTNTGDADSNPVNEIQSLALNGTTLKISQGNTVKFDTILQNGGLNLWKSVGNNIHNFNTGNVGINNTAPAVRLHVKGNGEALRVEGNAPLIGLTNGSGSYDAYLQQSNSGLTLGTVDTTNIVLKSGAISGLVVHGGTGYVGIGEDNSSSAALRISHPKYALMMYSSISGDFWQFGVDPNNGNLSLFNGASSNAVGVFDTDGAYTSMSDRRLKRDVHGLPGVLDKMMLLEPVSYHFNSAKENGRASIGFIAQDVQPLFPELVSDLPGGENENGAGYLSLNYAGFSVLAVKAIQEQQGQIRQLQQENETLRQRGDALEARISRLEKLLSKE